MIARRNGHAGTETVIGSGSLMEGTLEIDHSIRVYGVFRGHVVGLSRLVVGDGGEVEVDVLVVGDAEIHGKVTGRVQASHSVRLGATAQLHGTIETPHLIVEEGARLVITDPPE